MPSLEEAVKVLREQREAIIVLIREGKLRAIEGSKTLVCGEELAAILRSQRTE